MYLKANTGVSSRRKLVGGASACAACKVCAFSMIEQQSACFTEK